MSGIHLAFPNQDALVRGALRRILEAVAEAPGEGASVVLSGGRTPLALYHLLEALQAGSETCDGIDPEALEAFLGADFFWGDERWVAKEDPESNFGEAWRAWLSRSGIPGTRIHPIPTAGDDPDAAVAQVEAAWDAYFAAHPLKGGRPDVVILGMGGDGHTASLFPGQPLDGAGGARAMVARHPESGAWRVSLTRSFLNSARSILFLVSGAGKADVLRRVWSQAAHGAGMGESGGATPSDCGREPGDGVFESVHSGVLPAAWIRPTDGRLLWLHDTDAE